MKALLVFMALALSGTSAFASQEGIYGVHLFFDEKEFVDVLHIERDEQGHLAGHMDVPNDFSGKVENLTAEGNKIQFDLLVPRNRARPKDLIFHYEGVFHDANHREIIGFVRLKGDKKFLASFVGFRRTEVQRSRAPRNR